MKIKNANLSYMVLMYNSNTHMISRYNILGGSFAQDVSKAIKKYKITTRASFREWLKSEFRYHYWSKSECEILVGPPHSRFEEKDFDKIDIWYQIYPNLDIIMEYIIKEMNIVLDK